MVRLNALAFTIGLVLLSVCLCSSVEGGHCRRSTLTRRHEIRELNEAQLQELRDAFEVAFSNGAYRALAEDHGETNFFCQHFNNRFLPWHRRYIRRLEEVLGGISLPYWDWTKDGEPTAITNATYVDANGVTRPNPLRAALRSDNQTTTISEPWSVNNEELREAARLALQNTTIEDLSGSIEAPHNQVHAQIGGDMGGFAWSGFVPIFWFHHCFVDKLWYEWQTSHPNVTYPDELAISEDSDGTFESVEEVENLSGWQREGRTPRRTIESPSAPSKRLILVLKDLKAMVDPEIIEVHCLGQKMANFYSIGMGKPMEAFSDHPKDVTGTYHQKFANVSIELLEAPDTCKLVEYKVDAHSKSLTESPQPRLQFAFHWAEF